MARGFRECQLQIISSLFGNGGVNVKLRLHGPDRQGMECMLTIEDQITWSQANRGAAMVSRLSESKYF